MSMQRREAKPNPAGTQQPLSNCPECRGDLVLFRIIAGATAEYWTMRCVKCGGVHLDIRTPAET